MSWCDKLASVPGAGLKLDSHFGSSDALLDALSPITDRYFQNDKIKFRVTQQQSFSVHFDTDDGYTYQAEPNKLSVIFKHRMRAKAVSGQPPTMEMLSQPRPYTTLLPDVLGKVIEATLLLPHISSRKISRIGIISTTAVSGEEAPPGIKRFVEYIARPWGSPIEDYSIQVMADLGEHHGSRDRCIHKVVKPEDKDELLTVTLDWQRIYESHFTPTRDALTEAIDKAEKGALRYFEDVGEGRRFDETILRSARI